MGDDNEDVQIGVWGGTGGRTGWKFRPNDLRKIIKIVITYKDGDCINSIAFTYMDACKKQKESETFGTPSGQTATIMGCGCPNDELTGISGTWGTANGYCVITSLTFTTTKKKYGPYGGQNGTPFSLPVASGQFVGFFGRAGCHLDSIGVFLN